MKAALVIMVAGLSSCYGEDKQVRASIPTMNF